LTQIRKDIRALSLEEITNWVLAQGQPKYRSKQIYEGLWNKHVTSFEQITNIPKLLGSLLEQNFVINTTQEHLRQKSADGTVKFVFEMHDGATVEGVLIPTTNRMTACVSSQVGCSLDCKFCATGYLKRVRNLAAYEIFDQVVMIDRVAKEMYNIKLSNIVYMGMGEPLLNYNNVIESVRKITDPNILGMSAKRITISTSGIAKMIEKLADEDLKNHLALSLHAANNEKRSAIMPINDSNNLEMLTNAMQYWYHKTGTRPTLEYCVIEDTNESEDEALELVKFAKQFPCKINLIEYNPISNATFTSAKSSKIDAFAAILENHNLVVNIRRSRGKDIDAACGQLAGKND